MHFIQIRFFQKMFHEFIFLHKMFVFLHVEKY